MSAACLWCSRSFLPRANGGKPQRFCSETCRRDLDTAARHWVTQQLADGVLTVTYLRECLQDNARVAPIGNYTTSDGEISTEKGERP